MTHWSELMIYGHTIQECTFNSHQREYVLALTEFRVSGTMVGFYFTEAARDAGPNDDANALDHPPLVEWDEFDASFSDLRSTVMRAATIAKTLLIKHHAEKKPPNIFLKRTKEEQEQERRAREYEAKLQAISHQASELASLFLHFDGKEKG